MKVKTSEQYLTRYRARGLQGKTRASDIAYGDASVHLGCGCIGPLTAHRIGHGTKPDHLSRAVTIGSLVAAKKRSRSKENRLIHEPIENWKPIIQRQRVELVRSQSHQNDNRTHFITEVKKDA
jgi:hypothetical protein